jgi:uncharacterized protein YbjT (DUF2867 family)
MSRRKRLTALLAGATGLVGSECLQCLLGQGAYSRVLVVTRRELGRAADHPKLSQIITDFDQLENLGDRLAADHVFCALGTTRRKAGSKERFRRVDLEYPLRLAQIARAGGARHFSLVSAMGASRSSPFFYSRVKGELEKSLRDLDWPSLAIFRPSVIAGDRQESRPGERVGERLLRMAPARWRPVEASDIAAAMVRVALKEPPGLTIIESSDIATRAV